MAKGPSSRVLAKDNESNRNNILGTGLSAIVLLVTPKDPCPPPPCFWKIPFFSTCSPPPFSLLPPSLGTQAPWKPWLCGGLENITLVSIFPASEAQEDTGGEDGGVGRPRMSICRFCLRFTGSELPLLRAGRGV